MKIQNQEIKYIGVIGSRVLPCSYKEKVRGIVKYLLDKDYDIASGGAVGADNLALEALLHFNQSQRGVIFSAWQSISQFPVIVKNQVGSFINGGGKVNWGFVPFNACYNAVRAGLLARNIKLVSASAGIVAFLYGQSTGTTFTILQAEQKTIPVVAFVCENGAKLPIIPSGRWVPINNSQSYWQGAWKIVYGN